MYERKTFLFLNSVGPTPCNLQVPHFSREPKADVQRVPIRHPGVKQRLYGGDPAPAGQQAAGAVRHVLVPQAVVLLLDLHPLGVPAHSAFLGQLRRVRGAVGAVAPLEEGKDALGDGDPVGVALAVFQVDSLLLKTIFGSSALTISKCA